MQLRNFLLELVKLLINLIIVIYLLLKNLYHLDESEQVQMIWLLVLQVIAEGHERRH